MKRNFEKIIEKVSNSVVIVNAYDFKGILKSQGSGVILNKKGILITNYHIFHENETIEIIHSGKIIKHTGIIGIDAINDVLVIGIKDKVFPDIKIGNSNKLMVGEKIFAIGSPLNYENSVSEGIVSGLKRQVTDKFIKKPDSDLIQITAEISQGSSGGAVINLDGDLVGMSTMTDVRGQNINFAIPINKVLEISKLFNYNEKAVIINDLLFRAKNALETQNYDSAIKYYSKCIEIDPLRPELYWARFIAYYRMKKYEFAIADINKAIQIKPEYLLYYNRGVLYSDQGKYLESRADFMKFHEKYPDDADCLFHIGSTYLWMNDLDNALKFYNESLKYNPSMSNAYNNRALIYENMNLPDKAIKDYNESLKFDPENYLALGNLALIEYRKKNYRKSLMHANKAIDLSKNEANVIHTRGLIYMEFNEFDKALKDFKKAIALSENFTEAYCNTGLVLIKEKKYVESLPYILHAIKLNDKLAYVHNILGDAYLELNRLEDALVCFNKAIELDPTYSGAFNNRGLIYSEKHMYEEAIKEFNESIKLNNNEPLSYINKGKAEFALDNYENALVSFEKALSIKVNWVDALLERGRTLSRLFKFKEAILDFNKVIEIEPKNALAYLSRGIACIGYELKDQGLKDLEYAVVLDFNYEELVRDLIKEFKKTS